MNNITIVDKRRAVALLVHEIETGGREFIVAHGFDEETGSWSQGRYYDNLTDAFLGFIPWPDEETEFVPVLWPDGERESASIDEWAASMGDEPRNRLHEMGLLTKKKRLSQREARDRARGRRDMRSRVLSRALEDGDCVYLPEEQLFLSAFPGDGAPEDVSVNAIAIAPKTLRNEIEEYMESHPGCGITDFQLDVLDLYVPKAVYVHESALTADMSLYEAVAEARETGIPYRRSLGDLRALIYRSNVSGYIDSASCQQWVDELYDFEDAKEAVIIAAARNDISNDISHFHAEKALDDKDLGDGGGQADIRIQRCARHGCTDAQIHGAYPCHEGGCLLGVRPHFVCKSNMCTHAMRRGGDAG
ncbi:MAG: hypothetical protein Q4B30_06905 [Coriobacteriaceae bacterium]|nr:hypothetical protein [Coriobacteriaceae bacterium]